jgi:hypothetical protein
MTPALGTRDSSSETLFLYDHHGPAKKQCDNGHPCFLSLSLVSFVMFHVLSRASMMHLQRDGTLCSDFWGAAKDYTLAEEVSSNKEQWHSRVNSPETCSCMGTCLWTWKSRITMAAS